MQSGYGGVSEISQFVVDGGWPSNAAAAAGAATEMQKFHQLAPPPPHLQQQQPPPPAPPHFAHFGHHPIPITQQLFHHQHHHQFQLFHHHHHHHQNQLGLEHEHEPAGPDGSDSPARMMGSGSAGGGGSSFLAAMNFKLGVSEAGGRGDEEDGNMLNGDDGSESRLHQSWHREEEATAENIKEPFWRPLDIDYINSNNKRPATKPAEISSASVKHFKKSNEGLKHNQNGSAATADSNYKLYNELEAIYKPGSTPTSGGGGGGGGTNNSGSALTGDDNPLMPANAPVPTIEHHPDNVSDTSNGGQAPPSAQPTNKTPTARKKRSSSTKRRQQKQLASIATFFDSLVKQLMDHQEGLHRKFFEVMEKRDQERTNREEAWRKQEAARASREAAARAQERALAAAREAAIISFLEKITGESLNILPTKSQFQAQFTDESQKELHEDNVSNYNAIESYNADRGGGTQLNSSRWPKAEVQALIRVRSGLEPRFQEPGLKGPLWEGVSLTMGAMGYQRSSKRCKEKWENINKYFRKTKDSGKKRPQSSKTCPYFHQLDELYSKPSPNANVTDGRKDHNSELLDAIVVSNEAAGKRKAVFNNDDDGDGDNEEDGREGEEGQGESQGQEQEQLQLCEAEQNSRPHHDSAGLFHRLRS